MPCVSSSRVHYSALIPRSLLTEHSTIKEIAKEVNATPGQVLINWAQEKDVAVIPKTVTLSRVEENFKPVKLSAEQIKRIDEIGDKEPKRYNVPCVRSAPSLAIILSLAHSYVANAPRWPINVRSLFSSLTTVLNSLCAALQHARRKRVASPGRPRRLGILARCRWNEFAQNIMPSASIRSHVDRDRASSDSVGIKPAGRGVTKATFVKVHARFFGRSNALYDAQGQSDPLSSSAALSARTTRSFDRDSRSQTWKGKAALPWLRSLSVLLVSYFTTQTT